MDMDRIMGVLTLKAPTYRQIAEDPNATQLAGIIVAIVTAISGFFNGLSGVGGLFPSGNIVLAIIVAVLGAILGLIGWFVASWVLAFVAKWFGGKTNTQEMLRVTGFVSIFGLVGILNVLALVGLSVVSNCIGFIIAILQIVGYVIGVREAAEFSTGNAIITAIIAGIINAVIQIVLLSIILTPIAIAMGIASGGQ